MDKFTRNIVLEKIAAIYEDSEHKKRIRERREVLMGEEPTASTVKRDSEEEARQIEEWLKNRERQDKENKRRGDKDPRQAITPDQIEERSISYTEALKQRGINPDQEPLSRSEIERHRKIQEELNPFSTIGEVEGKAGSVRHYVDPNSPTTSPLNKYFGYYDKETQRWYPTQFSYIMFFLSAYAPELGLTGFLDRSRRVDLSHPSFRTHPYRRRYGQRLRDEFFMFKPEMEDRLFTDFPKIMAAIRNNVWDTNVHTREGLPYVTPTPPTEDRRFSGGVEIRYMPEKDAFMVRGPKAKPEIIPSSYEAGQSDALRLTKKILSKSELYSKLDGAISALKKDITDNVLREIISQNRELNFMRGSPEAKEQVRGAIINAINELLSAEVIRIINESEF